MKHDTVRDMNNYDSKVIFIRNIYKKKTQITHKIFITITNFLV